MASGRAGNSVELLFGCSLAAGGPQPNGPGGRINARTDAVWQNSAGRGVRLAAEAPGLVACRKKQLYD
ncbi:hypothetical protein PLANPX_2721 [Lacipirellula parvula]|uniref:Uncharacterized protein n=1 Tax=Lacipirellula parvula TaxID=2650471 RepID=A0A5K7XJQ1_9BACT|nr:hypothetical protein PLANPX_2721 [Lacipirellula parvula]